MTGDSPRPIATVGIDCINDEELIRLSADGRIGAGKNSVRVGGALLGPLRSFPAMLAIDRAFDNLSLLIARGSNALRSLRLGEFLGSLGLSGWPMKENLLDSVGGGEDAIARLFDERSREEAKGSKGISLEVHEGEEMTVVGD